MDATLNGMTFSEVQKAVSMSLGRNVSSANTVEVTDFGDCARCDFWWTDGACATFLHDSKAEAEDQARRLGFR